MGVAKRILGLSIVSAVWRAEFPDTLCAVAQALTRCLDGLGIQLTVLASFPSRNPELGSS